MFHRLDLRNQLASISFADTKMENLAMYQYYDAFPEPRTKRLSTNMSAREYQVVLMRKEELNIEKNSEFLRLMALGESQYPILNVPVANQELQRSLLSTTSNLNQLVRHMNAHGTCDQWIQEAWQERLSLGQLLNRTLQALVGNLDVRIVKRLATEMLDQESLRDAIKERNNRELP